MKIILTTCALFLVLPWSLNGETTHRPSRTMQRDTSNNHQTSIGSNKPTIDSTKNINPPLKSNGKTTHSSSSTSLHKETSEDHHANMKGNDSTIVSPKTIDPYLKPNGKTTHSSSSTSLHKETSEDHHTNMKGNDSTIVSPKNPDLSLEPNGKTTHSSSSTSLHEGTSDQRNRRESDSTILLQHSDEYTTGETKNVPSSKSPPQTSEHQHATGMSHAEYITHAIPVSTEERKTTRQLSSLSFLKQKTTDQFTVTPLAPNKSEVMTTTRDNKQPLQNFTNKGLDRHTHGNRTTRSAEKPLKQQTVALQTVTTNQSGEVVQTTRERTTKWSSLAQEQEGTQTAILNITQTLDIKNEERNYIGPYPVTNTSTTTGFSTGLSTSVKTEGRINGSTFPSQNSETIPTSQQTTKSESPIKPVRNYTSTHPFTKTSTTTGFSTALRTRVNTKDMTGRSTFPSPDSETISTSQQTTKSESPSKPVSHSKPVRNYTSIDPLTNSSTTTGFSTALSPSVNTKGMTSVHKLPSTNSETIPTSQQTTKSQSLSTPVTTNSIAELNNDEQTKHNPGHVVASLIGTILFLMFVAFIVVMVRNHQKKKKHMENPDWAGPSPFIETDINPNLPIINEDEPLNSHGHKRMSLYSFLPQRLSKGLSMFSPTEEEIPLEDRQTSSTFGQRNIHPLNGSAIADQIPKQDANSSPVEISLDSNTPENIIIQPLNGSATPGQIQTQEANSSPAEVSTDSNIPESVSTQPLNRSETPGQIQTQEANSSPAEVSLDSNIPESVSIEKPENNEKTETPKLDNEIIPPPAVEASSAIPTPCESVDLNLSLDKNTEPTSL